METKNLLNKIQLAIKGKRLSLSVEKMLQGELEEAFNKANISFEREVYLDKQNIVDFMIEDMAIEIKIKGKMSSMNIYRQLERYSKFESVKSILLITSKTMSLPLDINDKPVYVLSLGRTQL